MGASRASSRHRSAAPQDRAQLAEKQLPVLRIATAEQSWLLTRGYPEDAALKLVGDRHRLRARQREAVRRCACNEAAVRVRAERCVTAAELAGAALLLDGFNLLTTVESALGGGVVLIGRDGCARDLAGLGGTWRQVAETLPAAASVGSELAAMRVGPVKWLLDAPVSNSGRLAALLRELARARGWNWEVEATAGVDERLRGARDRVVVSADRRVLDGGCAWFGLARRLAAAIPRAWVLDLADPADGARSRSAE